MSKKIEPTDAMVQDLEFARALVAMETVRALRAALNHPDARGLFECDHTDYVHVDEAATRVEAAHEKGWDDAAQHIYNNGWEGVTALRKANPHRPAQELPTADGAVIVPADGHEFIETSIGLGYYVMIHAGDGRWRGGADEVGSGDITPGTWQVADQ